jgi:CBS domain-containing protein
VLIEHILQRKGAEVVTIPSHVTVSRAVAALQEHNIGALVVAERGNDVAGIISERDVVRAIAAQGPDVLNLPVSDLMSTELTTCGLRATVDELMQLMTERRIRHIPVIDSGKLAGIVSIGDVVKTRIDELETETETLHSYLASGGSR